MAFGEHFKLMKITVEVFLRLENGIIAVVKLRKETSQSSNEIVHLKVLIFPEHEHQIYLQVQ